ncbi:unnamed protein product, partial [Prunus brigantina]
MPSVRRRRCGVDTYLCLPLCASDPTDGFTRVSLAAQNLKLQIPYDKSPADRYSKVDGVERFWVYTNDKPFKQGSPTRPRTEIRISGYDYTSGVWQFEGNFYVPQGSSGVIIMQIHGAPTEATTLQQRVYNGDLKYYGNNVVASNIYDKWLRLNVIHNVGAGKVTAELTFTSSMGFMVPCLLQVTAWNPGGKRSNFSR